mmetsp:Transcript_41191/g.46020  ORF Transcript_41191/g.46020 Transcript_41191/m.46020 type:complete len:196 (+) Transcript_41191:769-1356(+)
MDQVKGGFGVFKRIIESNRKYMHRFKRAFFYSILPATALAFLLYYALDNPQADGTITEKVLIASNVKIVDSIASIEAAAPNTSKTKNESNLASMSWWVLFIFVRQVITFGLARGIRYMIITFCQRISNGKKIFGPIIRLLLIQSREIPLQLVIWGICDLLLLFGKSRFNNHWLYYQPWLEIFNDENPSGNVLSSE